MIKRFLILFIILLSSQCVFASNLKFIQVTDSYYGEQNTEELLEKTIADINTVKNKSFVVFTGDNINSPDEELLKKFIKQANKLKCPYYMVIGDHEVSKLQRFSKKDYMSVVRKYSKHRHPRTPNYVFKKGGIVFIVVDGTKEVIPGTIGYFSESTLKWLNKKLKRYRKDNVVLIQHYPIVPPYFRKSHETFDVDGYKTIIEKHSNIIAIISGHYNADNEKYVDKIHHISTGALIESPHQYKIIEIEKKHKTKPNIYTMLRRVE
jgi:3',5'-cyclic AMP phosphodiesterase CpdA